MGQDLIQHTSSIAYDRVGNGSPIVFVHGLTYDRRLWAPVVERLRDEYACVNIDLPGHGASLDAQTYDLDVVADNIHELIDRLELANPVMVGHSISGLIVGFYASLYPTAGIVTSDQTLRTTPFAERLWGMREQLQSPAFPGIWRAIESQLGIDLIAERYRPGRKSLEPAARGRAWLLRTIFEVAPAELQERLVEIIGKIDVPFTAIFGEEVDPDYCGWLTALVPQCELVVFQMPATSPTLSIRTAFPMKCGRWSAKPFERSIQRSLVWLDGPPNKGQYRDSLPLSSSCVYCSDRVDVIERRGRTQRRSRRGRLTSNRVVKYIAVGDCCER